MIFEIIKRYKRAVVFTTDSFTAGSSTNLDPRMSREICGCDNIVVRAMREKKLSRINDSRVKQRLVLNRYQNN